MKAVIMQAELWNGGQGQQSREYADANAHRLLPDAVREGDKHNLSAKVRGSCFEEELSGE